MRSDVNLEMCLLIETLVAVWHSALIALLAFRMSHRAHFSAFGRGLREH